MLAELIRSGFREGRHRGSLVLLGSDGRIERSVGDPSAPFFPRSTNKPAQAAAILRALDGTDGDGTDGHGTGTPPVLDGERLALAAASHSGEPFHLELARKMLADQGLDESHLRCPPDLPLDPAEAELYLAAGHTRSRIAMNCSGKHAAMLTACQANGWPLDSYLSPDHPLQQLAADTLAAAAGEPVAHTGTDGCGAPLHAVSLTGLARMYRTFALADAATPQGRVAGAMRAHPEYVAGTRRHDTLLMRELPGALSKMGAEAVQAVALPDGRAMAFKLEDGGNRAIGPVLLRALELLGVDADALDRLTGQLTAPLLGGGEPVGEVRATF